MPYAVIHYVLSGEGYINGVKIQEHTAFITSVDTVMDYFPSEDNPWSYIFVRLFGPDVQKAYAQCGFGSGITMIPFDWQKELLELLSLSRALNAAEIPDAQKILANALFLLHQRTDQQVNTTGIQEQNARKLKEYLDRNFYKKITVKAVADEFFLSKDYIRNLFSKYYGISPKQYLQKVRMERAKCLLSETDNSIKVIALSVGYDDPLLFSKMFSR